MKSHPISSIASKSSPTSIPSPPVRDPISKESPSATSARARSNTSSSLLGTYSMTLKNKLMNTARSASFSSLFDHRTKSNTTSSMVDRNNNNNSNTRNTHHLTTQPLFGVSLEDLTFLSNRETKADTIQDRSRTYS